MLSVALLTPDARLAAGVGELTEASPVFRVVLQAWPSPSGHEVMRLLRINELDVILVDLNDWDAISSLVAQVRQTNIQAVMVGLRSDWNRLEELTFQDAGLMELLREPFSHAELEAKCYEALHRQRPVVHEGLVAFLPAKAGSGCSTIALHTAAAMVSPSGKKVLVVESDRRSGVLGIMLNQSNRTGLAEVLQAAGSLTPGEWVQHCVQVSGMDLLLANPARPGPLPTWADYYQLLRFIHTRYGFIAVDMPELVNSATAEAVRSARSVCIVCTPDIPSLMMATQRRAEIESCGYPKQNIHVVINRWEKGSLPLADAEKVLAQPVFATLPNDYRGLKKALLESKLISADSAFAKACAKLARQLTGLPSAEPWQFKTSLLKHLGKMTE